MTEVWDVAIIGGGPAGQAAALALDGHGFRIAVIDEQPRPGGQILRQPPREFYVSGWMRGRAYSALRKQLQCFENAAGVEWLGGQSVVGLARGADAHFSLSLAGTGGLAAVKARHVLIATGCQDLAVPLPGWTLPGVYAAGGIQAFVKSQYFIPGERIVLAGTHPLQLLIAAQIVAAGGTVAAVLFAQPRSVMARLLASNPVAAARQGSALLTSASAMATLRKHGVPVRYDTGIREVLGTRRVTGMRCDEGEIACDTLGLCYGFVPQSALPRMAGAAMRTAGPAGGWAAVADAWMRSSVPGLYVAGETTGVAGAAAAMSAGTIAGTGIALDLGLVTRDEADRQVAKVRRDHERHLRFAALLDRIADPRDYFPTIGAETLVCRCEDVSLQALQPLFDGRSANAVKLVSRCGMGVCQGRNCEPTLLRLLDRPEDTGFTARFPARPVMLGDLAGPE